MVESLAAEKARIKQQRDIFFKALTAIYVLNELECYGVVADMVCDEEHLCGACGAVKIISDAFKKAGNVSD